MIFIKNFKLKKKIQFFFNTFNFQMLLLLHKTLKGSREIQGFDLIRAVLLFLEIKIDPIEQSNSFEKFKQWRVLYNFCFFLRKNYTLVQAFLQFQLFLHFDF